MSFVYLYNTTVSARAFSADNHIAGDVGLIAFTEPACILAVEYERLPTLRLVN